MSPWLKDEPSLVYDFFGRTWAESFCDREAVDRLGARLDAGQVGELRDQMQRFYTALFDTTDSGMAGLRQANAPGSRSASGSSSRTFSSPGSLPAEGSRFPVPPLNHPGCLALPPPRRMQASWPPGTSRRTPRGYGRARLPAARAVPAADAAVLQPQDEGGSRLPFASAAPPVRTDPDTWLASGDRHVLVGTPGSGKTTFLRHLVLDMLSDSPSLTLWTRRLGDRLPVWLPFHFFTWRQAMYRDANASLAATLRAWLEQHDAAALWPLVEVAL